MIKLKSSIFLKVIIFAFYVNLAFADFPTFSPVRQLSYQRVLIESHLEHLKENPKDIKRIIALGELASENFNHKIALIYYKSANELDKSSVGAMKGLAYTYQRLGKTSKAIKIYKKLVNVNSKDHISLYNLGSIKFAQNKLEEAKKYFLRSKNIHSGSSGVFIALGEIFKKQSKYEDAINYYKKASKVDSKAVISFYRLAQCFLKLNKNDLAKNNFKKFINEAKLRNPQGLKEKIISAKMQLSDINQKDMKK